MEIDTVVEHSPQNIEISNISSNNKLSIVINDGDKLSLRRGIIPELEGLTLESAYKLL